MENKNETKGLILLIILHIVGIVGLLSDFKSIFIQLTALNLIVTFLVLYYYQEPKANIWPIWSFIILSSFILEVIGVNTGVPFGEYYYGNALGPKIMGTPPLIGINWLFMAYGGTLLLDKITKKPVPNAFLTALAITLFDAVMEPVAVALDFWTWQNVTVPMANYVTWALSLIHI